MLVIAMMLLGVPGVRAQALVEYSLVLPILLTTSDEKCNVSSYKVETGSLTLAEAVTVQAAADPSGQGCLVRVKASIAVPAQTAAIETQVDGGDLQTTVPLTFPNSSGIETGILPLSSPDGSVVYEVVAEAKTSPPHESLRFIFKPTER
jgi:hypothetical protein